MDNKATPIGSPRATTDDEAAAIGRLNAARDHAKTLECSLDRLALRHRRLLTLLRKIESTVMLSRDPRISRPLLEEIQAALRSEKD